MEELRVKELVAVLNNELNTKETLLRLIINEIAGTPLPNELDIDVKGLCALSKKHDLAHIVFNSAIKNGLIDKNSQEYNKLNGQIIIAITRYQQQNYEFKRVRECFQKNHIRFVPLKGSIIREYYPEPWLRTSCDIDVLIHEEDLDKATELLLALGYTSDGERSYHDISFFANNVHIELHFNICESNKQLDAVLKNVWEYVEQFKEYEYRETSAFFMFHHVAHMAYHFLSGGCGIRPVLDLWILRKKYQYDENKLLKLLKKSNLVSFYQNVCLLSEIWFGEEQHNETTLKMEQLIIDGGVYGSSDKGAAIGTALHKGSKTQYKLSIVFPSYTDMSYRYPSLKKHKILLPFCYIHRIFTKAFGKKGKNTRKRAKTIDNVSKEEINEFTSLISELGLNYK